MSRAAASLCLCVGLGVYWPSTMALTTFASMPVAVTSSSTLVPLSSRKSASGFMPKKIITYESRGAALGAPQLSGSVGALGVDPFDGLLQTAERIEVHR